MNKSNEAAWKGFPERPPKLIKAQDKNTTFLPDLSTIITRSGAKVAYLSIPSGWSEEIHKQVLERVRTDRSDLRVDSFGSLVTVNQIFNDSINWGEIICGFITNADTLFVATDSTRVVGAGIRREIKTALRSKKAIIIFDVTRGCCRKYFGYDHLAGYQIRLRDRALTEEEKLLADRAERRRQRKRRQKANRRKRQMEGVRQ